MELKVCLLGTPGFLKECTLILQNSEIKVRAQATDADNAVQYAKELGLDLIIVDEELEGGGIAAGAKCVKALDGSIPVLLATRSPQSIQVNRDAQMRGLNGCLGKPLDTQQIQAAIKTIHEEKAAYEPQEESRVDYADLAKNLGVVPNADGMPPIAYSKQEIVMIYSPKGGVGKSTIAANLAAYIAQHSPRTRTLLLDFDVRSRMAHLISVDARPNLRDWLGEMPRRRDEVESKLVRHKTCGLWVLPGIDRAIFQDEFSEDLAEKVLNTVKRHFDCIVIDCGPDYRDTTLAALEHATTILMVATLDIATLYDIQQTQKDFEELGMDESKVKLIINRVTPKPVLPVSQVAEKLGYPLAAKLPEEPGVLRLANEGSIFALAKPNAPFTQEIAKLAAQIAAVDVGHSKKRGLLSLFGRGA